MPFSMRYSRGVRLTHWLIVGLGSAAVLALMIGFIQLLLAGFGAGVSADSGWFLLALALAVVMAWGRISPWMTRMLADADEPAHRARRLAVWLLVAAAILLIAVLKISAADIDAYKRLVFGEGGLVEWSQVLVLAAACRVAWLIGADLRRQLAHPAPCLLARGFALLLGLLLLEELAWGQVIFGWQTPESVRSINAQQETTIHNIGWFQDRLDLFTFLATLALLAAVLLLPWICRRALRRSSAQRKTLVQALMPAPYAWPLFLLVVGLAYCVATESWSDVVHNRDQEWGELVLYGSGLLMLLRTHVLLGAFEHQPGEL
ncbi:MULTISPECIES: pectate lyase [unclassified Synechococcus]|uniref:pectate lyase n=1 Tax=unclassified Synechococcus TaxID=2626047 RepID=UPI0007BBC542|nr:MULTISPECIES: pectate lyase [unclassified Synechococcus]KZR83800.1 hypothetical protein MITS9504_03182 [Synechococcus sp. MIT S9504]